MIRSIALYEGIGFDPHYNLAVEQYLLESVKDRCILYLWQNENTVVIGRNQNPWKECRTTLLSQEGGRLARRLSGGGAVFHDLGNLNFTFLLPQEDYDVDRQLSVIREAVSALGIRAEKSGRNDVLAEGRKFSGNAFYKNGRQAYHHGTLLVDVDMEKLGRYLSPSKAKLQAKGVDSVRSRVVNLKELNPHVDIPSLKEALAQAFAQVYGMPLERMTAGDLDPVAIEALATRNRSWEWNFGHKMPFTWEQDGRFPWGEVQICLDINEGRIRWAKIYSDSMDCHWVSEAEQALAGCQFDRQALEKALEQISVREELLQLLSEDAL